MPAAAKCEDEDARVAALYRYSVLDTPEEPAFDDVTRLVAYICQTPIAVVNLIDRDRQFFKAECGLGVRETPLDVSLCAHALLQQELMVVPDTRQDVRFSDNPLVTGDPALRFYAGALLQTSDGYALGTLCVLDYEPRTLTLEQQDALQILARQVMSLLELRRQYDREHKIAETLQRAMLIRPRTGQFSGLSVEPLYQAAQSEAEVGGDFFDTFRLPSGKIALVVGDVAGKGLNAAARTAEVKFALRVYAQEAYAPADALTRLNRFLLEMQADENRGDDVFVALALVIVNPVSGTVEACAAGAELPIILRQSGLIEPIGAYGLPLGVTLDARYTPRTAHLSNADRLVLLTDGVTEARQGKLLFGDAELEQTLREAAILPGDASVASYLLEAASRFANGVLRDDVCILVAQRTV